MSKNLLLSIIDQALLSALNLILALTLIAFATPSEFGVYALYFSSLLIAFSIQNALVVMPLNFLLPGKSEEAQNQNITMLTTVQTLFLLLVVFLTFCVNALLGSDFLICTIAIFYLITSLIREYCRNLLIVRGEVRAALSLDCVFALTACVSIFALWQVFEPAAAFLAGQAVACGVALLVLRPQTQLFIQDTKKHLLEYNDIRTDVGWSLLGASQTEVQLRGYVFIVQMWLGLAALGVLQAGRIVISPLLLIATAWARIARPRFVEMHNNQDGAVVKLLLQGILVILACSTLYGAVIWLFWPFIEHIVFKENYADMWPLVSAWWGYACVVCVNVCLSTLMQARRQFRLLTGIGFFSAFVSLVGLLILSQTGLSLIFAIWVLLIAEIVELVAQIYSAIFHIKYRRVVDDTANRDLSSE